MLGPIADWDSLPLIHHGLAERALLPDQHLVDSGYVTVNIVVSGANAAVGSCVTGASGQCDFTYTGTNTGNDTITATATIAGLVKTATASKTWTPGLKDSLALNGIDGYADAAPAPDLNNHRGLDRRNLVQG